MKTIVLSTVVLSTLLGVGAFAQYAPPPPPRPFPGFINERLRSTDAYMNAWDIAVNVRLRGEDKENAGFTDAGSNWDFSTRPQDDNNNLYYLSRIMPRVSYTQKWYTGMIEGRSSYSVDDERFNATAPGQGLAERDGPMDVHQAFVMLGNHKEFPVSLKIGRQELVYGEQRLVGHLRWNNNARTFDAAKVRWQNPLFGVDVFTGGLVYNDHRSLNRSYIGADTFSGAYFNWPTLATNEAVETYLLARNVSASIADEDFSGVSAPFRNPAKQDLYTAGLRIRSKPAAYGPWDYGVELMHQFGNRATTAPAAAPAAVRAAARLDQSAWAAVLQGGYTWTEHAWQPRMGLVYSYASGDKNAGDSESNTFQNLFATTHLHYGYMDLNSLQNLHDLRFALSFKPMTTLSVALEAHVQRLANTNDFWYNVAGVPRNFAGGAGASGLGYTINPSYSKDLGKEIDLVIGWSVTHYAQVELGLSRYLRGDYIKQSLSAAGSKDASYAYLQVTLNL